VVLFHYALVDDLISQEEFERRVEEKIEECGDLLDEPTAAMLVVGALGRQHVKVKELSGKSSLFCFFAKVVDKTEPKEFDRKDGEKGWVATLLVAALAGGPPAPRPHSSAGGCAGLRHGVFSRKVLAISGVPRLPFRELCAGV
jgi:replication factor A1